MGQRNSSAILSVVHPICCGLDVHMNTISATIITTDDDGSTNEEVQEFGAFTDELYRMKEWLQLHECPIVAMESTGVYWRPVHNVLEGICTIVLVNARHVKKVPGRKTDISDSRWLAGLLRHGLLKGSFIPPRQVREWRDLARMRKTYVQNLADYKRRIQKLFEGANIKTTAVVSDLFGATGRNLIALLCQGSTLRYADVQGCAKGSLKTKTRELYRSIQGFFTEHHRVLLVSMMAIVAELEKQIGEVHIRLKTMLVDRQEKIRLLMEVPGIQEVSALAILGELGDDLATFESSAALASWAGLCPGNNQSAGKRHSGRSPVRGHPLKTIMTEVAWGAVMKKGSYYREKYYRLKSRRGSKRAIIAIAHRILKAVFHILKFGTPYHELGEDYLIRLTQAARVRSLHRQATQLGYTLVPVEA
jgi:transposase